MRKPITAGAWANVEKGKLDFDYPAQVVAAIKSWTRFTRNWNGRVTVTIEPEIETRRAQANRYYRGVILPMLADESGHEPDDLHEIFKAKHNSKVIEWTDPRTGEVSERSVPQSTAGLNVEAFSRYLDLVMLDGSELFGIVFPKADPDWRTKRDKKAA